jgi:hypothetical protein
MALSGSPFPLVTNALRMSLYDAGIAVDQPTFGTGAI